MAPAQEIQIVDLDQGPELAILEGDGRAHAVIWPGMGAELRTIHRIELAAGARTIALRHPSDAVYYVMDGTGRAIDVSADAGQPLRAGSMAHVDAGTTYVFVASEDGLSLVGGPSPADPGLYEGLG
jgi:mannose-6-phosphate isomerase-like protein (cupin superfamily)